MENTLNREQLLDWYMDDILNGKPISNPYQFSKAHNITENQFYSHFANLEKIERYFFTLLLDKTIETLQASEEYAAYSPQEKLLSFYFTFFGNMAANRSFVMRLLQHKNLNTLKKLSSLRKGFKKYIQTLDIGLLDLKQKDLNNLQENALQESAWLQLLGTIRFWVDDNSPNFEKTDVFIEKSLSAGFELMNVEPLKKITDFGKFLFKELKP